MIIATLIIMNAVILTIADREIKRLRKENAELNRIIHIIAGV